MCELNWRGSTVIDGAIMEWLVAVPFSNHTVTGGWLILEDWARLLGLLVTW